MGFAMFLFRKGADGRVEGKVFDSDNLPGHPWVDSPIKCNGNVSDGIVILTDVQEEQQHIGREKPEHKEERKLETREDLIAEAERLEIEIDRRWGIPKLRKLLGLD